MTDQDGLVQFTDGPATNPGTAPNPPVVRKSEDNAEIVLWVVRPADVVHAKENCAFGMAVKGGKAKHSNLTGGSPAHCAGELLFRRNGVIVINGNSGRFGPRTVEEMNAVEIAFARSGYEVWTTGWDSDADRPIAFFVTDLSRVSA